MSEGRTMAKYVKAKDVKIGEKVCVRFKDKKTGKAETVTGWVVPGTRYTFRVQEKKYADDPVCVSKKKHRQCRDARPSHLPKEGR